jgi:fatty-acyl-CoA synthase
VRVVPTTASERSSVEWTRERMAAYKYPRIVEFTAQLPKSPVGKILWREMQDAENARQG